MGGRMSSCASYGDCSRRKSGGEPPHSEALWDGDSFSGDRHTGGSVGFDFGEGFRATLADSRVALVFANVSGIIPAALALCAVGTFDLDRQARQCFGWNGRRDGRWRDQNLRNNEERGQEGLLFFEHHLQA